MLLREHPRAKRLKMALVHWDLLLYRGRTLSLPERGNRTSRSDHHPVLTTIARATPAKVNTIPLSLIENLAVQNQVTQDSDTRTPNTVTALQNAASWSELEMTSRALAKEIIQLWARFRKSRSKRFCPGWTEAFDRMAKERAKLPKKGRH